MIAYTCSPQPPTPLLPEPPSIWQPPICSLCLWFCLIDRFTCVCLGPTYKWWGSPFSWSPLVAQMVKSLPAMQKTQVQSLGWEDPLEKEMATYSSNLAWKIPWMEESGRYSPWGHKELDFSQSEQLFTFFYFISDIIWYLSFSLWLTSFSMIISSSIHVATNGIILFFLWLSGIPLYTGTTSSLSIHLSMDV